MTETAGRWLSRRSILRCGLQASLMLPLLGGPRLASAQQATPDATPGTPVAGPVVYPGQIVRAWKAFFATRGDEMSPQIVFFYLTVIVFDTEPHARDLYDRLPTLTDEFFDSSHLVLKQRKPLVAPPLGEQRRAEQLELTDFLGMTKDQVTLLHVRHDTTVHVWQLEVAQQGTSVPGDASAVLLDLAVKEMRFAENGPQEDADVYRLLPELKAIPEAEREVSRGIVWR